MNRSVAFYLSLALLVILLLYAGGAWRTAGLVLFAVLTLWSVIKMLRFKVPDQHDHVKKQ